MHPFCLAFFSPFFCPWGPQLAVDAFVKQKELQQVSSILHSLLGDIWYY